jgi:hypothetical protein
MGQPNFVFLDAMSNYNKISLRNFEVEGSSDTKFGVSEFCAVRPTALEDPYVVK